MRKLLVFTEFDLLTAVATLRLYSDYITTGLRVVKSHGECLALVSVFRTFDRNRISFCQYRTRFDGAVNVRACREVDPVEAGVDSKASEQTELSSVAVAGGDVDGSSLEVQRVSGAVSCGVGVVVPRLGHT